MGLCEIIIIRTGCDVYLRRPDEAAPAGQPASGKGGCFVSGDFQSGMTRKKVEHAVAGRHVSGGLSRPRRMICD